MSAPARPAARQHHLWRRVYKSLDAGKTWQHLGLRDTRHIGAIVVDPRNPDIAFVAALGHAFGPTRSAGSSHRRRRQDLAAVLFRDRDSGGIDVVFDPRNPNTLFASLWQMRREPWAFSSGGAGSGLYRSTDGGFTWQLIEHHGLPDGPLGRIGVPCPARIPTASMPPSRRRRVESSAR